MIVGNENAKAVLDASLAEFAALRQEIAGRSDKQHTLVNLNITAAATIIGLIATQGVTPTLLLLATLTSSSLGMLWADHARTISNVARYINEEIRTRVNRIAEEPVLEWENKNNEYINEGRSRLSLTFRVPMLLIFAGPPLGALGLTPFLSPSVAKSEALFWLVWGAGFLATGYMSFLLALVRLSAPSQAEGVSTPQRPSSESASAEGQEESAHQ